MGSLTHSLRIRLLLQQGRSSSSAAFTVIEPLVLTILLAIVVSGTAVLLTSINRSAAEARRVVTMNRQIDSNLAEIKQLSGSLTCCASTCSVSPPVAFGTNQNCATDNPLDSRYFFPQRDNPATTTTIPGTSPATADERAAVDQLCASGAYLTPLVTAINATAVPAGTTRTTTTSPAGVSPPPAGTPPDNTIQIVYTDTVNSVVARAANITPPMARWCP